MSKPWDLDLAVYGDEAALLDGLRRKDRYACTCMLKRYAPRLYHLALQLTKDPDEAEDILQEAIIRGCDRIDDFKGLSSLGTWLHRIVLNTALMHLRRKKPDIVRTEDFDLTPADLPADDVTPTPSEPIRELVSKELREEIEQAVLDLPDTLRTVFVLREIEGLSTAATASALGITESAAKVRLHRARLALRDSLAAYVNGPTDAIQESA